MDIIKVIQETATWIEKVNNDFNTNLFRSAELSPNYYYYQIPDGEKLSAVNRIVSARAALLVESGVELIPVSELHNYGRIMIFDPDSTTTDGAPEAESACYIDIGDSPPWDTWLAVGAQLNGIKFYKPQHDINAAYLIAWVPKSHYFYANDAVEVSCIGNLAWASNEFIRDKYDPIKELFCKPVIVKPDGELFCSEKTSRILNVVQQELERNSKSY
ncbi:hypothetical protein [Mucilaginibacter ginsenosidivorax]|uniref:Uncharacterized protein n=1 Tax=Mucilaginibacter ginsenosidivorax TaxID=862126 RepID=A0A5B8W1H1_9SPHI|nr:hypothetical protein [Mucilaginibacter ginsenosidivorax]QEC76118.1 hypothetical protein FSB76_09240 [Mucilaginibacter ginsenosidivorax]